MVAKRLMTVEQASAVLGTGVPAVVAGTDELLARLPHGNWIGGTMRYFMSPGQPCDSPDEVLVVELPSPPSDVDIRLYDSSNLSQIVTDAPDNGYSIVIIPAGSPAHLEYAARAPYFPGLFRHPIVGWISGVALQDLGTEEPATYDGRTGRRDVNRALVLHSRLPARKIARITISNPFHGGDGDVITFPSDGLAVADCLVNGQARNFAEYLVETKSDTRLPLVADYAGAQVNTSFQSIDPLAGIVHLYAPVFSGIEYRIAAPVSDYFRAFRDSVGVPHDDAIFACNCILNYVYGDLQCRPIGQITGPMTFGEIAYQLLNQTLVCLSIDDVAPGLRLTGNGSLV
jgi:hypothetical protein